MEIILEMFLSQNVDVIQRRQSYVCSPNVK